jgi:carbon starvation protein CstA
MAGGEEVIGKAPGIVNLICENWLGVFGSILAILGVVAAPITSGDTALRSARLIIADFIHLEQKSIRKRLYVCIPMFAAVIALLIWQMSDKDGFEMIWSWFGWSNQTLSVFTLWAITVYLVQQRRNYFISLIPAMLMTTVSVTYLFSEQIFNLDLTYASCIAGATCLVALVWFIVWMKRNKRL